jgi:hypothetical protein
MRPRLFILLASLAINLLLVAALSRRSPEGPKLTEPVPAVADTAPAPKPAVETKIQTPPTIEPSKPGFKWAQLESEDYTQYIARLRAFGVPERTVRDIIVADIQKLYRPKLAALRPKLSTNANFWENRNNYSPFANSTKEQRDQMNALQKEQRELTETLLGKNIFNEIRVDNGYPDWTERMLGPIPTELRDKVQEMQQRFQETTSEIYSKANGYIDQDTQVELKTARKKLHDEMATVLTPEQIQEFELRNSDTANNMRYQLAAFGPDEKEFRAIFKYKEAQEELNSTRVPSDGVTRPSPEEMKARQQAQKELEDGLSQTLGADRLKEYRLMSDGSFQNLYESGVSRESILKLADMKQNVEDAARKIRTDQSMTPQQRNEALQAIRAETEKELANVLGERRAKAYPNSGGYWLRNIAPVTRTAP